MILSNYLNRNTSAAPLAVFRIIFGSMIFVGVVRFWLNGWIETLYIEPTHFFPFQGFEFVRPLGRYTYLLFIACGISALLVAVGLFYRIAIVSLFTSFTYIELIDKSTYLNHYYFVSMICLMMIVLPAHCYFSLDARRSNYECSQVPAWCIDSIKLFVCIVYLFAGIAKINADWLLHAQPLRIWLPAKNDLPGLGPLFNKVWAAYLFSWAGCLYDLSIPFLLLYRKTRIFGLFLVIAFHALTAILFPIGMFPYIMIGTALIFLSHEFHEKIITLFRKIVRVDDAGMSRIRNNHQYSSARRSVILSFIALFLIVQLILPMRFLLYPGHLAWNEEGYRFSWRVMLMEKAGYTQFTVMDSPDKYIVVNNSEFLTPLQEKAMSSQPDMILQYAHMLADHYKLEGFDAPKVYVDSYVTLNGRPGRVMIDPKVDLASQPQSIEHYSWILPFETKVESK